MATTVQAVGDIAFCTLRNPTARMFSSGWAVDDFHIYKVKIGLRLLLARIQPQRSLVAEYGFSLFSAAIVGVAKIEVIFSRHAALFLQLLVVVDGGCIVFVVVVGERLLLQILGVYCHAGNQRNQNQYISLHCCFFLVFSTSSIESQAMR